MVVGLKLTGKTVPTNIGNVSGSMIRVKDVPGSSRGVDGDKVLNMSFDVYESRAKYDAGDDPLITAGFSQAEEITIAADTEVSTTSIHQALTPVMEARGFTVTEETDA